MALLPAVNRPRQKSLSSLEPMTATETLTEIRKMIGTTVNGKWGAFIRRLPALTVLEVLYIVCQAAQQEELGVQCHAQGPFTTVGGDIIYIYLIVVWTNKGIISTHSMFVQ